MKILGIESSCDETAASVVEDGRNVLSNIVASQAEVHALYGGVVPEIASRKHIEKINQVIEEALSEAKVTLQDITAIAVTYGPGLVGALLVGVSAAKAISFATGIPLIGVHHIEGHISANYIENKELEPPYVCLVVSGGHSHLVVVKDYGEYEIIGNIPLSANEDYPIMYGRSIDIRKESICFQYGKTFKEIEMTGFKSFADTTKISFDGGITAIVGPNGLP